MITFKSFDILYETNLLGSISGGESYKPISHFKAYVAPFLKAHQIKDAKEKMSHFGDASKIEEKDGQFNNNEFSHQLHTKHGGHESGTHIKVYGIHHIDDSGRIHLDTSHGVIPQSKIKKPELLARKNITQKGFNVEEKIAKNLGGKPAGSTKEAYDYSYGDKKNGLRGSVKEANEIEAFKALKSDGKPLIAGESKLSNCKMGSATLKWSKENGWKLNSAHKKFEEHMNKHARTDDGVPIIEHLNKHYPNGKIDKGFSIPAPKGSAKSYLDSSGINSLHIHDKKTDKGTTFTVGDNNELKGKTNLGHLSDDDINKHLDGRINIERTLTGSSSFFHRPKSKNMLHLASLSQKDEKNHKDLTNGDHAKEFINRVNEHYKSDGSKSETGGLHMFDVDDTLFHTTARIHVVNSKTGETVRTLDNSEFNTHTLPDGHHYDFHEFRNADKFHKESKPIPKMIAKIRKLHDNVKKKAGSKVILNTARADFDDKDRFLDKFKQHGIDIDNIHVERAGNIPGNEHPAEKKAQIVRNHLARQKYRHVSLYDDSKANLNRLLKMKDEYPDVQFHAYHVQPDGTVKKHKDV